MARSKSSTRWLQEHFEDPFVKKAQAEGWRSRAVYKLKEVDEKEKLLRPGMTVVDLGAAPGGWTQYASQVMKGTGLLIALDILPMDHFADVVFIEGDFREESVLKILLEQLPSEGVDLVLSDMAPNMSGNAAIDIPRSMDLAELALEFAKSRLKPGGALFMKLFHGEGFDGLVKEIKTCFKRVVIRKPKASRSRSRETYLLARDYTL